MFFLFVQPQFFINLLLARAAFQIQKPEENSSAVSYEQLIQRFFIAASTARPVAKNENNNFFHAIMSIR